MKTIKILSLLLFGIAFLTSCDDDDDPMMYEVNNPTMAEEVSIDRFSDAAGTLMRRSENSSLPAANAPINFDQAPFITKGLGPNGQLVEYYNFDVQSDVPAPIYLFFIEGSEMLVDGQLNVIDVIPGDEGYSDFWEVYQVTVPADYVANTVSSLEDIEMRGFTVTATGNIVNCPVVPDGKYGIQKTQWRSYRTFYRMV